MITFKTPTGYTAVYSIQGEKFVTGGLSREEAIRKATEHIFINWFNNKD